MIESMKDAAEAARDLANSQPVGSIDREQAFELANWLCEQSVAQPAPPRLTDVDSIGR